MKTIDQILESVAAIGSFKEMTAITTLEDSGLYKDEWLYASADATKRILYISQTHAVIFGDSLERITQFSQGIVQGSSAFKGIVSAAIAEYCVLEEKRRQLNAAHSRDELDMELYAKTKETPKAIADLDHAARGYQAALGLVLTSPAYALVGNLDPMRRLLGNYNLMRLKNTLSDKPDCLRMVVDFATAASYGGK